MPGLKLRAALIFLAIAPVSARAQPSTTPNPWWRGYEVAPFVHLPDGRRLRVYCMGKGAPTVILESGTGDGAWAWRTVQPAMARNTRVCSYDRAGLGLSEEAHGLRDSEAMAADLAVVVKAIGQGRPVVLAGQSLGGSIIRQYAYRHMRTVAGMVLVDPSSDHQAERLQAIDERLDRALPAGSDPTRHCLELTEKGPIPEGTDDYRACIPNPPGDMPADLVHIHYQYSQSPIHLREVLAERDPQIDGANDRAADAARHSLGNMPMIILTAGENPRLGPITAADMEKVWVAVYQLHNEMAGLSTNARHRVIAGAGHNIQYDKPQAVIEAVAEVVADVRTR